MEQQGEINQHGDDNNILYGAYKSCKLGIKPNRIHCLCMMFSLSILLLQS